MPLRQPTGLSWLWQPVHKNVVAVTTTTYVGWATGAGWDWGGMGLGRGSMSAVDGGCWAERQFRSAQGRPGVHLVLLAVLVLVVLALPVLDLLVLVVLGLPLRVFLTGSLSCPLRARLPWSASMS